MPPHQYATDSLDCEYSIVDELLAEPVVMKFKRGRKVDAGRLVRECREIDALASREFAPQNDKIGKNSRGIQTIVERSPLMLAVLAGDTDALAVAMVAEYLLERYQWQTGRERISRQGLVGSWQFVAENTAAKQSTILLELLAGRYETAASLMVAQHCGHIETVTHPVIVSLNASLTKNGESTCKRNWIPKQGQRPSNRASK